MYNYLKDENLNFIYEYLLKSDMFDKFIDAIINENELYTQMLNELKKQQETSEK